MSKFKTTSVSFDDTSRDLVEQLCKKTDMTRSNLLRQLIVESARYHKLIDGGLLLPSK
jgi:hypothetical protein